MPPYAGGGEVAFWTLSGPIGKCLMLNLENINSSGRSRLSLPAYPENLSSEPLCAGGDQNVVKSIEFS